MKVTASIYLKSSYLELKELSSTDWIRPHYCCINCYY